MRGSMRYDRKPPHAHKRAYPSRGGKYGRASPRCRVLFTAGAFLLLAGILWSFRPRDAPVSEGIDKSSLERVESLADGEQRRASGAGEDHGLEERAVEQQKMVLEISPPGGALEEAAEETADGIFPSRTGAEAADEVCDRAKYPAERELQTDRITILMNGFSEARVPLLEKHVQMYSSLAVVHSIYILWGNTSTAADFVDRWTFLSYGAPIYVVRQSSASLNDRFLPRPYIETAAVMVCDDDITVDPLSLGFALDVWREDPGRIVGFFPRAHAYDPDTGSWMYVKHYKSYSIMLTKLMIMATEYLFRYTCEMPDGVKEFVDAGMNCEDIAMNFLASDRSGKGPVLVEGKARDWGDPRNTAVGRQFGESALSARKDHRKNRGDCITEFARMWRGMKLQLSFSRASPDLENRIQCEKFGLLMDCDLSVASRRDARRGLGEHLGAKPRRLAYATFLHSDAHFDGALVLAQSLRSTGTIHDLVALLGPACGPVPESHFLRNHYEDVVRLNSSSGELDVWLLVNYVKVVFLEIDSLVLANLDHLFQLPELAAAPMPFVPGKFSTGLLILTPSKETHARLLDSFEKARPFHGSSNPLQHLNFFFDEWFQTPAENRLPARYNVPLVFSELLQSPAWFDPDRIVDLVGPPMVIRFGNSKLGPRGRPRTGEESGSPSFRETWIAARLTLLRAVRANELLPLDDDNATDWVPPGTSASGGTADVVWPPHPVAALPDVVGVETWENPRPRREAFATIMYSASQRQFVAGWVESFRQHHAFRSRASTLLLVLSTVDPRHYARLGALFDRVRVVEPMRRANGAPAHESFAVLHLWAQPDLDKLVYVAADSLFLDNCHSLLDYAPFAAIPSLFPPDTFSARVMRLRPARATFDQLVQKLSSPSSSSSSSSWSELGRQPVDRFLNAHYSDWYVRPARHRISPAYAVSAAFEGHFHDDYSAAARPWKAMSFDLDWVPPDRRANSTELWKKMLCGGLGGPAAPESDVVMSLCGAA